MLKKFTDTGLAILGYVVFGIIPALYLIFCSCDITGIELYDFVPGVLYMAVSISAIRRRWKH